MAEEISSDVLRLVVSAEYAGMRLDKYISEVSNGISRSYAQKLIENGDVDVYANIDTLPYEQRKTSYKVRVNEIIEIDIPEASVLSAIPENIGLNIVYEDGDIIIVNKPQGMVTHPAPGTPSGTLVNALMFHCADLSGINGVLRPGIVHRLDKDTSGLLAIAKNDAAHLSLSEQIATKTAIRTYYAIVENNFSAENGVVETQIGRAPNDRLRMAVLPAGAGRWSKTEYKVLERFGNYTFLELRLYTGRTHQIRVHMSYINHPVLGDRVYGSKKGSQIGAGQFLHAGRLEITHPRTLERMAFTASLPDYFAYELELLRKGRH